MVLTNDGVSVGRAGAACGKGRGVVLFSGGLDSILAVEVLREQGCYVEGVVFSSPFYNHEEAERSAHQIGLTLRVLDFTGEIAALLVDPPHGFGKAMNPCIDCHAAMLKRAGLLVGELGWDFVATGEVLNQRPMSQTRQALRQVAEASGFADIVLRPLSAQLLEPTAPERAGLVDRERLLALSGRSRKPQMELAERYGVESYPGPAGGCLLTEPMFGVKLRDLLAHEGAGRERDLLLLRLGRHFRLPGGSKAVVGRDQSENSRLRELRLADEVAFSSVAVPGPVVLLTAGAVAEDVELAAGLCAGFSDHAGSMVLVERCSGAGGEVREQLEVLPLARATAAQWRI